MERGGGYDTELWKSMVAQGWPGVDVSEADGGLGLGPVEVAVLLEEVGGHAAPAPFLSTVLALNALAAAGRSDDVERLMSGEAIGCVAWSARGDAVRAEPAGGGWELTGRPD